MEELGNRMSETTNSRGGGAFLYGSPLIAPASGFSIHSGNYFDQSDEHHPPIVKMEAGTSQNRGIGFHHPPVVRLNQTVQEHRRRAEIQNVDAIKAKIAAHPQYSNLLEAFVDCQKVGATPEAAAQLASIRQEIEARQRSTAGKNNDSKDPELDQFMEAYYDMLVKYREDLSRPLQEAMEFMRRVEMQLKMLTVNNPPAEDKMDEAEVEVDHDGGCREEEDLKKELLKKYSGYLSSLKQELSKKKKKGKLPKEARQKLLAWWELHYKWPYPSESEKSGLAESTGLDQKQINNWFINQRKRHWKPSEDMQMMVMEQSTATFYMDDHCLGSGPYRLGP